MKNLGYKNNVTINQLCNRLQKLQTQKNIELQTFVKYKTHKKRHLNAKNRAVT